MFNFVLLLEICLVEQLLLGSSLSRSNFKNSFTFRRGVESEKEGTGTWSVIKRSALTFMSYLDSHSRSDLEASAKPVICAVSIFS